MKITMLPSDMDAPGCYRVLFPMRQMVEQGGHDVQMPPRTMSEREDGRRLVEFEVSMSPPWPFADIWVLQQRGEKLWAEGGVQKLRKSGIVSVADVDDNYVELPAYNPALVGTHPYRLPENPLYFKGRGGQVLNRKERRDIRRGAGFRVPPNPHNRIYMHSTLTQADHVTVSTPYLANLYERFNKNITVLRNYLDWDIWEDVTPQYEVERERRVYVGYLGVFRYRQGDLEVLRDVVPEMLRRHPQVDFVANSGEVHDYLRVPKDRRVTVDEYSFWQPDGSYPVGEKTAVLDIGLVPLQLNGLNQAKSHLKGMEYNAAGVPFIATPTESYLSYWCNEGENGFLARDEQEWYHALDMLIEDDQLRRTMGCKGRRLAETHTYQIHWPQWESLYQKLIGGVEERIARAALARGAVQKVSEFADLLRLLHGRPLNTIVEVGSARGGTFWALSHIAADDALLVSIDIPAGSPIDVRGGEDVYAGRDRRKIGLMGKADQTVKLIDANSQLDETRRKLLHILQGRRIDVLLIDADHRYQGVKRDYELYSPLVRPGGIIAFHDIAHHLDKRVGVEKFWKHIRRQHKVWEFVHPEETHGFSPWGGIGVIEKESLAATG